MASSARLMIQLDPPYLSHLELVRKSFAKLPVLEKLSKA